MKQVVKLLRDYDQIKDDLLDYTDEHHDSMMYDIRGYRYELNDDYEFSDQEVAILKKQVEAFRLILNAYKSINYIYG